MTDSTAMPPKLRVLLATVLCTLPPDQLSKLWVESHIPFGSRVEVLDGFFFLTHARNPGAAFGMFGRAAPEWRLTAFLLISVLALVVILSFYRRLAPGDRLSALALGLILGGASGNFVDRFWREEVVDFLHVRLWGGLAWPDFNLADMFIIAGVGVLLLQLLSSEAASRARSDDEDGDGGAPRGPG